MAKPVPAPSTSAPKNAVGHISEEHTHTIAREIPHMIQPELFPTPIPQARPQAKKVGSLPAPKRNPPPGRRK